MNIKIFSTELLLLRNRNSNLLVYCVLFLFCLNLLVSTLKKTPDTNIFDLLMQMENFFTLSYIIIPLYLFSVTSHFSIGEAQKYLLFRFSSRRNWYHTNILLIALLTTIFILLILVIMSLQALFALDFENKWSNYALDFHQYFRVLLSNNSPLFYTLITTVLVWLLLFFLGMTYYVIYIWTKNPIISFLCTFSLNILNIGVTTGKIESLSLLLFTNNISIMQHIYSFNLSQESIPYSIFSYWFLLISIVYFLGFLTVNKVDLDPGNGDKNGVN